MTLYEVFHTCEWEGSLWFTSKAAAYKCRREHDNRPKILKQTLLPPTRTNLCRYLEGRNYVVRSEEIEPEVE